MIQGKIVRILSETEVVLNVGFAAGVQDDMEFVIYATAGEIVDPDSGNSLGELETVKGRVKVHHVMERISRARTLTYEARQPSIYDALAMHSMFGVRTVTQRRELNIAKGESQPVSEDTTVHVGDLVRSVT